MNIIMPTYEDTFRYGKLNRFFNNTKSGNAKTQQLCGSITRGIGYRNLAGRMAAMSGGGGVPEYDWKTYLKSLGYAWFVLPCQWEADRWYRVKFYTYSTSVLNKIIGLGVNPANAGSNAIQQESRIHISSRENDIYGIPVLHNYISKPNQAVHDLYICGRQMICDGDEYTSEEDIVFNRLHDSMYVLNIAPEAPSRYVGEPFHTRVYGISWGVGNTTEALWIPDSTGTYPRLKDLVGGTVVEASGDPSYLSIITEP